MRLKYRWLGHVFSVIPTYLILKSLHNGISFRRARGFGAHGFTVLTLTSDLGVNNFAAHHTMLMLARKVAGRDCQSVSKWKTIQKRRSGNGRSSLWPASTQHLTASGTARQPMHRLWTYCRALGHYRQIRFVWITSAHIIVYRQREPNNCISLHRF